jgi:hypothetical protein
MQYLHENVRLSPRFPPLKKHGNSSLPLPFPCFK